MPKFRLNRTPGTMGSCRARCPGSLPVTFALPLAALCAGLALAHTDSPGSPPLAPSPLRLQYRTPAEIVALFARERLPGAAGDGIPRAARIDTAESLLPPGVDAVLQGAEPGQVVLVSTAGVPDLRACIRVLDAPLVRIGRGRERIVLTLREVDAGRLRAAVLRLPEAGTAVIRGRQLVLEGNRAWLHRALRQVIRAELKEPESLGLPSPITVPASSSAGSSGAKAPPACGR